MGGGRAACIAESKGRKRGRRMVSDVEQGTPCMLGDAMGGDSRCICWLRTWPVRGVCGGRGGGERKKVMAGMGLL